MIEICLFCLYRRNMVTFIMLPLKVIVQCYGAGRGGGGGRGEVV